ncbi:MAG: hypothetical protein DCC64_04790 [Planctomycetota bacterium]|nr:MAG: hypothetical protein DCC64_04790 [Planctomycetota bacterium]
MGTKVGNALAATHAHGGVAVLDKGNGKAALAIGTANLHQFSHGPSVPECDESVMIAWGPCRNKGNAPDRRRPFNLPGGAKARHNRTMVEFMDFCKALLAKAGAAGFGVLAERKLDYGRQYELSDAGGARAVLSCYHGKKGFSFVTGGKQGHRLQEALGGAPKAAKTSQLDPFGLGFPHIGGDESGKGDFFGPLVVAAFYTHKAGAAKLIEMGVADCKTLSDAAVERLAHLLKPGSLTEAGLGLSMTLMPREYNVRYGATGNLNVLLAQLHGECVAELLLRLGSLRAKAAAPQAVLIDQFASNPRVLQQALSLPEGCRLVTRTGGEADVACAAASVLARAEFLNGLRTLSTEYGQDLPPGAGTPVIKAGREFKRAFGAPELAKVAKTHFKTLASL